MKPDNPEILGVMILGVVSAFRDINVIDDAHARDLMVNIDKHSWYPMADTTAS